MGGSESGGQKWRRHRKSGQGRAMQCEGIRVCSRAGSNAAGLEPNAAGKGQM